jgi:hypothetical protein
VILPLICLVILILFFYLLYVLVAINFIGKIEDNFWGALFVLFFVNIVMISIYKLFYLNMFSKFVYESLVITFLLINITDLFGKKTLIKRILLAKQYKLLTKFLLTGYYLEEILLAVGKIENAHIKRGGEKRCISQYLGTLSEAMLNRTYALAFNKPDDAQTEIYIDENNSLYLVPY